MYTSTQTFESKTQPGVSYTLRKWSLKRRNAYNAQMVEPLRKLRLITDEIQDILKRRDEEQKIKNIEPCTCDHGPHEAKPCPVDGCKCRLAELTDAETVRIDRLIQDRHMCEFEHIHPLRLRWAVEAIKGLEVDGREGTLEDLIEYGPDELSQEILESIDSMLFLSPAEVKNSSSPITSTPPADGATMNTDAAPAKSNNFIEAEIVGSGSQTPSIKAA